MGRITGYITGGRRDRSAAVGETQPAETARQGWETGTGQVSGKTCPACGTYYEDAKAGFGGNTKTRDGLRVRCRLCVKAARDAEPLGKKIWRRERRRLRLENLKTTDPERWEFLRKRQRVVAEENRKSLRLKRRAQSAKRRCWIGGSGINYTPCDIEAQYAGQGGKCYWCEESLATTGYHIDHVVPLSRGGSNHPDNIVLACRSCNLRKADILPWTFAPHRWMYFCHERDLTVGEVKHLYVVGTKLSEGGAQATVSYVQPETPGPKWVRYRGGEKATCPQPGCNRVFMWVFEGTELLVRVAIRGPDRHVNAAPPPRARSGAGAWHVCQAGRCKALLEVEFRSTCAS